MNPSSHHAPILKVGIVGLGRLGRRHAENLMSRVAGATLVAACSPLQSELEWARDTLQVPHLYEDYAALLAHGGLDAVFLVTPTSLHPQQIIQALRAGKHVFCEKPLSLDLEDCRRVSAEAALHPQLQVMIGFVRRFDASYQDAYRKIQQGAIGSPFMVYSQTCDQYDPDGFFVKFAATSGGIFLDCSVHDIDLARWLLGNPQPVRVYASGTRAIHHDLQQFQDVDNGVAICEFDNGKLATFYASRTMAHGHDTMTEITGTAGRLTVGGNARKNRLEIADAHGVRNECLPSFFERFEDAFLTEVTSFVEAIRRQRKLELTLDDATEATRIGIALRESLLSKQPVLL
ncbi:Gfo/Idh/MocA family oxidoreductase [Collimonas fungivorans]|nr:Gfo/Idh/MocA family oxidoreductase [Collimonas fungivorans]